MTARLNHNDEAAFRAILADHPAGTGGFTASIASLRGLIGELDHLREMVRIYIEPADALRPEHEETVRALAAASLSGLEPFKATHPYGARPDGSPKELADLDDGPAPMSPAMRMIFAENGGCEWTDGEPINEDEDPVEGDGAAQPWD